MDILGIIKTAASMHQVIERSKSYCDYIAHVCAVALTHPDPERIIKSTGSVKYDLHPTGGYTLSTKKTIEVEDRNGQRYRVTVEEIES